MTPEHEANNVASWKLVLGFIDEYPESTHWSPWKKLARRFVDESIELGLDRYFRAGQSMSHMIFSTLDHHGLRNEPRVTVELHPENELRIAYGTSYLSRFPAELEYSLPYDDAFPTFRRFLNQLWIETVPEALPDELRGFSAPILTKSVG